MDDGLWMCIQRSVGGWCGPARRLLARRRPEPPAPFSLYIPRRNGYKGLACRPVALTVRASDSKSEGWGFESLLACQRFQGFTGFYLEAFLFYVPIAYPNAFSTPRTNEEARGLLAREFHPSQRLMYLARITSAYSFQRSWLVRVSYSAMCGSAKPCRYILTSDKRTMSGEMS
jgi:hypothetical protein